jgi:release factor glutamine methyltransferase
MGTTAADLLNYSVNELSRSSESARTDALLLLAGVTGKSQEWFIAHPEAGLTHVQVREFQECCERRTKGEPIAYILGSTWFYGRKFVVNESVLVPRPETEHIVDEALRFIGRHSLRVLDVGTGCGAIACTIAAETNATVSATDSSRQAIATATQNACHLGVMHRCHFHVGDLTEPVGNRRFDVVIANLPYIATGDLPKAPDPASFEPRIALDGGPDGLALYRRLLPELPSLINRGGTILLEAAPPIIDKLASMVQSTFPNFVIEVGKDYSGLARYVKALG